MTKNIEICKAEEVGAQVLDILGTTAERQTVAALNAAFGLAIPLPAAEPGEITELPAAVSAHDRQLLAQILGKPEPAATLSTTDPLATFVATLCRELYRHLAARTADYLPADFPDPFARNLAHLLQAVQSLSPRKISNGGATNDGIKDGISLAHLLCDTTAAGAVTILQDDNNDDWSLTTPSRISTLAGLFPNAKTIHVGCSKITSSVSLALSTVEHLYFDNATEALNLSITGGCYYHIPKVKKIETTSIVLNGWVNPDGKVDWPEVEYVNSARVAWTGGYPTEIIAPKLKDFYNTEGIFQASSVLPTTRMVFGTLVRFPSRFLQSNSNNLMANLIDFEVGQGTAINLNLSQWGAENVLADADKTATFLQNFRDHIALRLTDQGSGLTLTLSQAVRNAIHAAESTYGIEDIIVNQKHWTLSPAPSA